MDTGELGLFTAALELGEPWRRPTRCSRGHWPPGSSCGLPARYPVSLLEARLWRDRCPVHDIHDKTRRHLDFFQHKAFLHARVPRVRCPEHGVRLVALPWARPGSGFTMLFEALVLTFARRCR